MNSKPDIDYKQNLKGIAADSHHIIEVKDGNPAMLTPELAQPGMNKTKVVQVLLTIPVSKVIWKS